MAKLAQNHIKHQGKIAGRVHVTDGKYKDHTRNAPSFIGKGSIAAMKGQFSRTETLNKLGSEINKIIAGYAGRLRSEDFYRRMQSRFRKVPGDNRYILLSQLKDLEVNERYNCRELAGYKYEINPAVNEITIDIQIDHHYLKHVDGSNCYYLSVVLLAWSPEEYSNLMHFRKKSRWITVKEECPRFIFSFALDKPVSQWLLCIGQQIGRNNVDDLVLASKGMKIVHAGTFLEEDLEIFGKSKLTNPKIPKDNKFPEFNDSDDEIVQALGDKPKPGRQH
jgi:hypothetical protein